ncbi:MAG TPA: response regulator [Candidatus Methanoperedens sp.]|nr:response regulator [Candidatus Methanoperedens sp.]
MDDDLMIQKTMGRQLAVFGYEVVAAGEGREAVTAYAQAREAGKPFDAVILDLMVRDGWGGEQTLSELMRLDPQVRAILCSGTLAAPAAEYERKGFRGVLDKPYSLGQLRVKLEAMLPSETGFPPAP